MCLKWQICRATMERTELSSSLRAISSRWNRNSFSQLLSQLAGMIDRAFQVNVDQLACVTGGAAWCCD